MSFEELGSVLRAEREKRGLSLDSVAEHLKISVRILRSLEEGDDSSLPHAVYVRGFVRSYGNYLGLDSEELQEAMLALSDEEQEVQPTSVYGTSDADGSRGGGKLFLILLVLLCAAGAALFWFYRDADLFSDLQQSRLSTAQPAPPLNARPEAAVPDTANKISATSVVPSAGQSGAGQSGAGQSGAAMPKPVAEPPVAAARTSAQQVQAQQMTQAQQLQAQQAAQAQQSVPVQVPATSFVEQGVGMPQSDAAFAARDAAPVSGNHKIIITALAECWIHSSADSTDTRQFSLRKGDTFALTFVDKLVLKLGNAGGVRIRYNGEDLPPQGKDGQVKTLAFPLSAQ